MSDDDRTPIDQALDLLFYAPIGLALNAEELVGQMAARGRQSVAAARFIGQMAMQQGRTEVDKALDRIQDQAATLVEHLGQLGGARSPHDAEGEGEGPAVAEPEVGAPAPDVPTTAAAATGAVADVLDDAVDRLAEAGEGVVAGLDVTAPEVNRSIPDYDSLAASQVVPRLGGLTAEELETVRRYEAAHRSRTTILTRIAQLQRQ
jgi:hypothetical protein